MQKITQKYLQKQESKRGGDIKELKLREAEYVSLLEELVVHWKGILK